MAFPADADALAAARARVELERLAELAAFARSRRRRRTFAIAMVPIVLAVIATVAGIAEHRRAHKRDQLEQVVREFSAFTDQACECTTAACANKVTAEITTWSTALAKDNPHGDDPKPDPETLARMTALATRFTDCLTRALAVPQ